jgi:hypothetical protein
MGKIYFDVMREDMFVDINSRYKSKIFSVTDAAPK